MSVAVFVLVAAWLLARGAAVPLGAGFLDPAGGISAQDEAVYSHAAIRMAETGDWLTPFFLDRFFLYKPPLVYWLAGLSVKLFGVSAWALRLPAALSAAGVAAIVFHWIREHAGPWRAAAATAALVACPLFLMLGRRNLTDAPLTLFLTAFCWLAAHGRPAWAMAACVAGALLVKSTAGLIPLLILAAWWPATRYPVRRWALVAAGGFALALPWFLYQWQSHGRWFMAEFIGVELLAYGAGAPPQTTTESAAAFYATRIGQTALVVFAAAVCAVPAWVAALRRRDGHAWMAACWVAVMAAAIAGYQYRNATYLLPLLPGLALAAGLYAPAPAAAVLLLAPLQRYEDPPAAVPLLRMAASYCEMNRDAELIVVGLEDNFSITTLPLTKVRYALEGSGQPPRGFALDFAAMGVAVSVGDFLNPEAASIYGPRLRTWGLPDTAALGTVISWPDGASLASLIGGSPRRDFLLPAGVSLAPATAHRVVSDAAGNRLLLAPGIVGRSRPAGRTCRVGGVGAVPE